MGKGDQGPPAGDKPGAALDFLLPSKGLLGTAVAGEPLAQGVAPVYLCDHDSQPPAGQVITTDPENILIRALKQKRRKANQSEEKAAGKRALAADTKGGEGGTGKGKAGASNKRSRRGG